MRSVGFYTARGMLTEDRPIIIKSAMGLLSTVLSIYTDQKGQWSITAVLTGVMIGCWLLFSVTLYWKYYTILEDIQNPSKEAYEESIETGVKDAKL